VARDRRAFIRSGGARSECIDREIILASVLSFASHVTFPAVASFLVLYARQIQIDNLGWFYVASGTTSLLARPLLGRVSDNIGRRRALLACFVLQAIALLALAYASHLAGLMISGMLYMIGLAMASSTTLAIAMEQAKPERRGRAMATFSVALPLSNGVGALICGVSSGSDFPDTRHGRHCRRRSHGNHRQPRPSEIVARVVSASFSQNICERNLKPDMPAPSFVFVKRDRGIIRARTRSRYFFRSLP
jgi:hypothetical protein